MHRQPGGTGAPSKGPRYSPVSGDRTSEEVPNSRSARAEAVGGVQRSESPSPENTAREKTPREAVDGVLEAPVIRGRIEGMLQLSTRKCKARSSACSSRS